MTSRPPAPAAPPPVPSGVADAPPAWLTKDELAAWVRMTAVLELLPGVLDSQLRREADLTHFEYYVLAMLSEAPERTLRMTSLAAQTNATLPRLSHVVRRLETRGLVERFPCPEDGRATNARLTDAGWDKIRESAPGHVATVRRHVVDALTPEQLAQFREIADAILGRLDPAGVMTSVYRRHDGPPREAAQHETARDEAPQHDVPQPGERQPGERQA